MSSIGEFAEECEAAAKALRRIPSDLRRALSREVKTEVAEPLARKIGAAAGGPWARVLDAGTKARASADPQIVVGGARPRLSGGAGPRDVVFGTEFGGGGRIKAIPRTAKRKGHRRMTTNQFINNHKPFVFPTIEANLPAVLDTYADITLKVLNEGVNHG